MRERGFLVPTGIAGSRRHNSAHACGALYNAARRNAPPSYSSKLPNLASQSRVALSNMAWNTGSSSPGDLLMTCSTSEVAVLLQRFPQFIKQPRILDGDDGLIREGLDQRELLGGEGSNFRPPHRNRANEDTFATHRHAKKRPDTATFRSLGEGTPVRIGLRIEDLYCPVLNSYAPDD